MTWSIMSLIMSYEYSTRSNVALKTKVKVKYSTYVNHYRIGLYDNFCFQNQETKKYYLQYK